MHNLCPQTANEPEYVTAACGASLRLFGQPLRPKGLPGWRQELLLERSARHQSAIHQIPSMRAVVFPNRAHLPHNSNSLWHSLELAPTYRLERSGLEI